MPSHRKEPGPDHPIAIAPLGRRVTVRLGHTLIAQSDAALALAEANYPVVVYIPRADVRMDLAMRTQTSTHCPYKGAASYYGFRAGGTDIADVAWSYESPYPAMARIAGHLAFYPSKAEIA